MSYLGSVLDPSLSSTAVRIVYSVKTANYTMGVNEGVITDTSGGTFTITLPPAPAPGDQVWIADKGYWGTNALTVSRNGNLIEGSPSDLVMDVDGASVQLVYDGTGWNVFSQIGSSTGTWGGFVSTTVITSAYSAASNDLVRLNSTGGGFTVTLPSSPSDGTRIAFNDVVNKCGTNPVLVAAAGGKTVEGDVTGMSINVDGAYAVLMYVGSTNNWKLQQTPTQTNGVQEPLVSGTNIKTVNGSSILGSGNLSTPLGFKNFVTNGNFSIAQRGTTVVTGAGSNVTLDCWRAAGAAGSTVSQIMDHPTYGYCGQFTNTGGYDWHMNRIEARDAINLTGKEVTLSFWAKNVSGNNVISVSLATATVADNFAALNTEFASINPFPISNSWTRFSCTGTVPATGINGIEIRIVTSTGAGGASVQKIADVQLEIGPVATDFESRPFFFELARCQRYYEKSYSYGVVPGTASVAGSVYGTSTGTVVVIPFRFAVTKRSVPVLTFYSPPSGAVGKLRAGSDVNANDGNVVGETGGIAYNPTSGSTANQEIAVHYTASAEL